MLWKVVACTSRLEMSLWYMHIIWLAARHVPHRCSMPPRPFAGAQGATPGPGCARVAAHPRRKNLSAPVTQRDRGGERRVPSTGSGNGAVERRSGEQGNAETRRHRDTKGYGLEVNTFVLWAVVSYTDRLRCHCGTCTSFGLLRGMYRTDALCHPDRLRVPRVQRLGRGARGWWPTLVEKTFQLL